MADIYDFASQSKVSVPPKKKPDAKVNAVIKYLKSNKIEIDNVICIIKYKDDVIDLVYNSIDVDHWSRASKMLDYKIFQTMTGLSNDINDIED